MCESKPMAIINPKYCKQLKIHVELDEMADIEIPHLIVYHDRTYSNHSIIRLDEPKYIDGYKTSVLTDDAKREFVQLMESTWKTICVQSTVDSDSCIRIPSSFSAAVQIWTDVYGVSTYIYYDDDGFPIIPYYEKL